MSRNFWLALAVLALSSSVTGRVGASTTSPGGVELPVGIFALNPAGKTVPVGVLDNDSVSGVVLRGRWQEIEPVEGQYDFEHFERQIERAAKRGKKVMLRLNSGGRNTPDWLLAKPGIQSFKFKDRNVYHTKTYGEDVTIPVFWDATLQQKEKQLIEAVGARFGADPSVLAVSVNCANSMTGDWNFPARTAADVDQWVELGYTEARLFNACKKLLEAAMAAFPSKVVTMPIGGVKLDRPRTVVAKRLIEYAAREYPERFLPMRANLAAHTPDPENTSPRGAWRLLYDHGPYAGAQMLWNVSKDTTFRMNGKVMGIRKTILRRALNIGIHHRLIFMEVYIQDLLNPEFQAILSSAASKITEQTNAALDL